MKLAILVGHSKKSPGAFGVKPLNQSEYVYNSEIAQKMKSYAEEKSPGIACKIFLRDNTTIKGVGDAVNQWAKGDKLTCAIELHFNAFNGKARGAETLYDNGPAENKLMAETIHKKVLSVFEVPPQLDRKTKLLSDFNDRGFANCYYVKIPSCLVEPGFGDNTADATLLHKRRDEYARGLVDGCLEFLKFLSKGKK